MAGSVNKVILMGNLGKDPDVRHFEEGRAVASFPIATSESYKDKNGELRENTDWHNVVVWRSGLVGVVEKYLKKGNKVYVEGKLKTRSYEDQDKNTKYITEIIVDNLVLLGGPNRGDETSDSTNDTKTKDDAPF
ncbi:single-stranded DNA-binding protein [Salibacteraceae bacterium]|jgi:single-strand DNA-binding protein|nr:single-stranded DNA-binding protein [Crocinitomicaceae bacterium]MCH9821855.1 single-stranded DNA-binding protein [Bacteroidota bacterium]MDC1204582.1 single-stranded DNA-binding protein [Salibacteraceae bacterium]|tara:strand:- start:238498 stop:238899 length:402 start_codon:yes stop_codon:yes gene_type:complete